MILFFNLPEGNENCEPVVYRVHVSRYLLQRNSLFFMTNRRMEKIYREGRGRILTHCGRMTQICVFNKVNLGTFASSP